MVDFITQLQPGYIYPAIFFGHIFLGGLIFIPALYLALIHELSLPILFVVIVTSSMAIDSVWYVLGKGLQKERVYSLSFIQSRMEEARRFSTAFSKYGVWAVFFTKFIYGTRIASHIFAGIHKIDYWKFLGATAAGTSIWFGVMYFMVKALDKGVSGTASAAFRIQIIFLTIVTLLLLLNWFTGTYVRNRLMRKSKPSKSRE